MDSFLKASGYVLSTTDPCMCLKLANRDRKQCLMLIALYVDDIVLATNDTAMLNMEENQLKERFQIEDERDRLLLGYVHKERQRYHTMQISQKACLENILKRFN